MKTDKSATYFHIIHHGGYSDSILVAIKEDRKIKVHIECRACSRFSIAKQQTEVVHKIETP